MPFQYAKLRGRIVEKFGTMGKFAEALGTHINVVSRKLNGKRPFSKDDIEKWAKILEISIQEIGEYFFA